MFYVIYEERVPMTTERRLHVKNEEFKTWDEARAYYGTIDQSYKPRIVVETGEDV